MICHSFSKTRIPATGIYPYILWDVRAPRYERFKVGGRPGQWRTMKPAADGQTRLFFRQDFGNLKGQDQQHINAKTRGEDYQPRLTNFRTLHSRCENNLAGLSNRRPSHSENGRLKSMLFGPLRICGSQSLPGERILETLRRKPVCSTKG